MLEARNQALMKSLSDLEKEFKKLKQARFNGGGNQGGADGDLVNQLNDELQRLRAEFE